MRRSLLLAAILMLFGAFYNIFGEHIGVCNGLGYDGAEYGTLAINFDDVYNGKTQLSTVRVRRILPSFFAHTFLKTLHIQANVQNVVAFFKWYNLALLLLATFAWGSLSKHFNLDAPRFWLGALGLFCNHAMLKYNMYYPVLTDVSGFCFAIFMMWAFFFDKRFTLALLTLLGTFIWPTLPLIGALLLLFPQKQIQQQPFKSSINFIILIVIALLYCLIKFDVFAVFYTENRSPYFPLSLSALLILLITSYAYLFDNEYYFKFKNFISGINFPNMFILGGVFIFVYFAMRTLIPHDVINAGPLVNKSSISLAIIYARSFFSDALNRPGEFIVAHVMYFGPLLFFTICFYRKTIHQSQSFGYGFLLVIALSIFHMLMPLSRHDIAEYPFIVLITVLASQGLPLTPKFMAVFTSYALVISKVWMLFNLVPATPPEKGWVEGFSFENYVSSTGWWMSDSMYAIQGALIIFSITVFYFYFIHLRETSNSKNITTYKF